MATVANPFSIDEQNQGQVNLTSTGQGITSPMSQGQPSGPAQQPKTSTPSTSGSFQNLSKYIGANRGFNAQQGGLAGTVSGGIGQQAQQQQQNIQGAQKAFGEQAQQNVGTFNNLDAVQQAATDPYGFLQQNPTGIQQVQAAENAQYTGPSGFESLKGPQNLTNLSTQASNLSNLADQTQSQAGQFNLLKQMFGTPSYTSGQQSLDQAIMSSGPNAQQEFARARQAAAQASQNLSGAQQQAQQQAQQYGQQAQQVQATSRNLMNQAVASANQNIQHRLNDIIAANKDKTANIAQNVYSGNLTDADIAALGGTPNVVNPATTGGWYGLTQADINKYVTQAANPTVQQAATKEDYDRMNALSQLLGGSANVPSSATLQQFTNPTQAGQLGPAANLDVGGLANALQQAEAGYKNRLQGIYNQAQGVGGMGGLAVVNQISPAYQDVLSKIGTSGEKQALQNLLNTIHSGAVDRPGLAAGFNPLYEQFSQLQPLLGPG